MKKTLLLILIILVIPFTSISDSTSTNYWVKDVSDGWNVAATRDNSLRCGQTRYFAFGSGTGRTGSNESTAILRIECGDGAVLVFDTSITEASSATVRGTIDFIVHVVANGTTVGGETLPNSDVIEPVQVAGTSAIGSGSSNPEYGLEPGQYWIQYDANASFTSLIRVRARGENE